MKLSGELIFFAAVASMFILLVGGLVMLVRSLV